MSQNTNNSDSISESEPQTLNEHVIIFKVNNIRKKYGLNPVMKLSNKKGEQDE